MISLHIERVNSPATAGNFKSVHKMFYYACAFGLSAGWTIFFFKITFGHCWHFQIFKGVWVSMLVCSLPANNYTIQSSEPSGDEL